MDAGWLTREELEVQNNELRLRLQDAEDALRAIQSGEVDALVVSDGDVDRIFTLQGAEATYRTMVEAISEGAASLLGDGTILYANKALSHLLDVPLEQLVGSNLRLFVEPDDQTAFDSFLEQGLVQPMRLETNLVCQDHTENPVMLSASPLQTGNYPGACLVITDLMTQKRNRQLLSAERMTRSILEQAGEAIVVCDPEGIIIRANQAAERLAGQNPLYYSFDKVFPVVSDPSQGSPHPISIPFLAEQRGRSVHAVIRRRATGHLKANAHTLIQISASALLDDGGDLLGYILLLTDMTERAGWEQRIAYQARILENLHDAVIGVDNQQVVTTWNRGAETLYGVKASEAIGETITKLGLSGLNFSFSEQDLLELERMDNIRREVEQTDRNGTKISVDANITVLRDPKTKEVTGYISANHDITSRKQAEVQLRENQERLQLTTGAAEVGTWTWDLIADQLTWDERTRACFGLAKDFPISYSTYISLIHPEDMQRVDELANTALSDNQLFEGEFRVLWPDGSEHWVMSIGKGSYDPQGNPIAMNGVLLDITARKRAEQDNRSRMAETEIQHRLMDYREMERLQIARDLHDGPLQDLIAITFAMQGLINDTGKTPLGESLHIVQTSLLEQIGELRNFAGALRPPSLATFGLEFAIRSHLEGFRKNNLDLYCVFETEKIGLSVPEAVRMAIFRIYQELLINVARHSKATRVQISLQKMEDQLVMIIEDNGQGFTIPGQWLELARQGHLGLVGVRERAEAIGGKVEIQTRVGEGTRVVIEVPTGSV